MATNRSLSLGAESKELGLPKSTANRWNEIGHALKEIAERGFGIETTWKRVSASLRRVISVWTHLPVQGWLRNIREQGGKYRREVQISISVVAT
jgi:hypothetical protein